MGVQLEISETIVDLPFRILQWLENTIFKGSESNIFWTSVCQLLLFVPI